MPKIDPREKITDALTDPEARTDMLSTFVSKEQKRFDTAQFLGAKYGLSYYADWQKVDRRQQMAMVGKNIKPRSAQLTEAMATGSDNKGISSGTRPVEVDEYMDRKRK